ncbi:hypothetical protein, partial [Pseudorhodobacter sp.]|uniref:hypothetical protein n=1 Tax=Pseudorhodobacter sp. TaxID=1934400 RepID=UPI002AFE73DB
VEQMQLVNTLCALQCFQPEPKEMMKMDWSSFTNRISELEIKKRKPSANRRAVFEVIRGFEIAAKSGLRCKPLSWPVDRSAGPPAMPRIYK